MAESSITTHTSTKKMSMVVANDDGAVNTPTDQTQPSTSQSVQVDSDDDSSLMNFIFNLGKPTKSNEPLRPGDVIRYYSPMYVYGK